MTEKELLAIVYALKFFWHYITSYSIYVQIDHATIKYLLKKPTITGRLTRWLLLLQEFDITIVDKPRKANVVADYLSRIHHNDIDTNLVDNAFSDGICFIFLFKFHVCRH